jgi:acetyl esterase
LPAVVFFHGGGWVLGDLDTHDALCRRLAKQANCAVVSVNYRRAPEHRFPAALDDCYDATSFVAKNSSELGIDAKRLVVAGDSAGGNLAAGVAVRSRDEHGPAILAQVLIYPSLDAGCDSPSYAAYASGYGLTKADMQWFWRQYLEDEVGNALAVPSKLEDLRGLPPTFILTAEYVVLRDEAETFARQIRAAGGKVRLRRIGGTIHGFVHFAGKFDAGLQATSEIAQELASFFGATDP